MKPDPLQSFYADIRAARLGKIPIELESRSLLQSVANPTKSQLATLADSDKQSDVPLAARHQAAIDIHAQLGTMVPVLDGLSARAIASQQFSKMFRRVLLYLALVLLFALLGLLFFKIYVMPEYEAVRRDMRMSYKMTNFHGDMFPYMMPAIVVVSILLFFNVIVLITNKTAFFKHCSAAENMFD